MLKKTRLVTTYELGPADLTKAIRDYCRIEVGEVEVRFEQDGTARMHAIVTTQTAPIEADNIVRS